ncbi:hypothetical protein SUTMEG_10270 [Sutterella megalosphaeroides]|uniref:Uncharacterized protein n=1 Tax=Sutterella megalosphaeroides TaxID=2494234 RepID=A0A2Z6IEJ9_9BURK|nr:hypothetical protein SUTMEG_10270 [Sutterella megalosphaeroides]
MRYSVIPSTVTTGTGVMSFMFFSSAALTHPIVATAAAVIIIAAFLFITRNSRVGGSAGGVLSEPVRARENPAGGPDGRAGRRKLFGLPELYAPKAGQG